MGSKFFSIAGLLLDLAGALALARGLFVTNKQALEVGLRAGQAVATRKISGFQL
jgi:hypothetical protein